MRPYTQKHKSSSVPDNQEQLNQNTGQKSASLVYQNNQRVHRREGGRVRGAGLLFGCLTYQETVCLLSFSSLFFYFHLHTFNVHRHSFFVILLLSDIEPRPRSQMKCKDTGRSEARRLMYLEEENMIPDMVLIQVRGAAPNQNPIHIPQTHTPDS